MCNHYKLGQPLTTYPYLFHIITKPLTLGTLYQDFLTVLIRIPFQGKTYLYIYIKNTTHFSLLRTWTPSLPNH